MGELIPTTIMDVLPGDKVKIGVENLLRFSPLVSPVMHDVNVKTHYFFVPNRLVWAEWDKWITGDSDVVPPTMELDGLGKGTIGDYMGFPMDIQNPVEVNALPLAAYAKIYDEYFRDQNLQDEVFTPLTAGNNAAYNDLVADAPLRRAWMHDYFTSALPFAQKGDAVTLPLTTNENVEVTLKDNTLVNGAFRETGNHSNIPVGDVVNQPNGTQAGATNSVYDPQGSLEVDVNGEATDITTLRRALKLQEWLERNARAGTRYIENIFAHFGVKSKDARLQRPEYIGASQQKMVISEVLSTAQTTDDDGVNPVGQMSGHGISVGGGNSFQYTASEHGFIIGIISVTPKTGYFQGIHKMYSKTDRLDYYWPSFAHIGEQEVKVKELYMQDGNESVMNETFGYVPRYSEYKYLNDRVSGEMRDTLKFWHLAREFDNKPSLNAEFIECDPTRRIFAVTDPTEHTIYAHIHNHISAIRKMPKFGNPGL